MAEIIVLDYSDATVHIYHDEDGWWDIEDFLFSREWFRESEIGWMSAPSLTYHHHGESRDATVFRIDRDEIEDMAEQSISDADMAEMLSLIEGDEWIWEAIERAKRDTIDAVLRK